MNISRIEPNSEIWCKLINYSKSCSWVAGKHLADMMENNSFTEWESVFAAISEDKIVCTFSENRLLSGKQILTVDKQHFC